MHQMSDKKNTRGLKGIESVKYRFWQSWRKLVLKHLRDNEGVWGAGESLKCSQFMAIQLLNCMGTEPALEYRKNLDPLENLLDNDDGLNLDPSDDGLIYH